MEMNIAAKIGARAVEAMLYEVSATPKPGLVDRVNNGAHRDMDFFTFMSSAAALRGSFDEFAALGVRWADQPIKAVLPALQAAGVQAEQQMFAFTRGINTHKGMIFSLGLLTSCAGRLWTRGESLRAERVLAAAAELCAGLTAAAYQGLEAKAARTKGEAMYLKYGVTGVRGEAEGGFPMVRKVSLPAYRALRAAGLSINDVLVGTLMALMAENQDTNILGRHDMETLVYVQQAAKEVLRRGGVETETGRAAIEAMDADLIARYISPGGSADLVAVTHFLYAMEQ